MTIVIASIAALAILLIAVGSWFVYESIQKKKATESNDEPTQL